MSSASLADNFESLQLTEPVLRALTDLGYQEPTPIQLQMIPYVLEGRDVVGQAQTGTGKTAAFALPLLSRLTPGEQGVKVLILTPTRELAIQVTESFIQYGKYIQGLRVLPIYGGQGYDGQLRELRKGVQVIVGTPGRIMDHIRRNTLKLDTLDTLVLDEADEMLRMGFFDDVEWIMEQTPSNRQVALFSATMPPSIRKLASKYLDDAEEITIRQTTASGENIHQRCLVTYVSRKFDALCRILETEKTDGVIIFAATKTSTVELTEKLEAAGHSAVALNGDITQKVRERT
ncbi:MAG: DEAD/DEAH box helicase, partial [Desulfobulbaceae bacterium]|nr:DEAD/DEAH box helicase [Desulfobulbaceae bacterium]